MSKRSYVDYTRDWDVNEFYWVIADLRHKYNNFDNRKTSNENQHIREKRNIDHLYYQQNEFHNHVSGRYIQEYSHDNNSMSNTYKTNKGRLKWVKKPKSDEQLRIEMESKADKLHQMSLGLISAELSKLSKQGGNGATNDVFYDFYTIDEIRQVLYSTDYVKMYLAVTDLINIICTFVGITQWSNKYKSSKIGIYNSKNNEISYAIQRECGELSTIVLDRCHSYECNNKYIYNYIFKLFQPDLSQHENSNEPFEIGVVNNVNLVDFELECNFVRHTCDGWVWYDHDHECKNFSFDKHNIIIHDSDNNNNSDVKLINNLLSDDLIGIHINLKEKQVVLVTLTQKIGYNGMRFDKPIDDTMIKVEQTCETLFQDSIHFGVTFDEVIPNAIGLGLVRCRVSK